ncbi:MAG: proline dehydrogenase family protein, partial [Pseudomonadota bacterium]
MQSISPTTQPSWYPLEEFFDIYRALWRDESALVKELIENYKVSEPAQREIAHIALEFIDAVRRVPQKNTSVEQILRDFPLSSTEGQALLALAEGLIRIPDDATQRIFLADILSRSNWQEQTGSTSKMRNTSTKALAIFGRLLNSKTPAAETSQTHSRLRQIVQKISSPVIHKTLTQGIDRFSKNFIFAPNLPKAIQKINADKTPFRFSLDILGEAALTKEISEQYFNLYVEAITLAGQQSPAKKPNLSLKLSALSPRFELTQTDALKKLEDRLFSLLTLARQADVAITIDAEEIYRYEPTLIIFRRLLQDSLLREWEG